MLRTLTRSLRTSAFRLNKNPLIHENGLYYGKFTKEEYEKAKAYVTTQYEKLEKDIKGTEHVREKVGKMPQFPSRAPAKRDITNLLDFFLEMIKTTGPIPLSAYMRQCLTHPEFGYYTTRNPLDATGGDFITSPEISSVFGEMIGIWLYSVWSSQGSPQSIRIVEFGPGKGTLMHDVVVVFNKFVQKSKVPVDIEVVLVEASHILRKEQWLLLCNESTPYKTTQDGFNKSVSKWGNKVTWVDTEKDILEAPNTANYVLAHEFFDALPIKSFTKTEHGWREHVVEHTPSVINTQPKLEGASTGEENVAEDLKTEFHLTLSPKETPSSSIPTLSPRYRDLPEGLRIEVCADAEFYLSYICKLVNDYNKGAGAALIIDYGPANEIPSNSLRGIYKHKFVSPFYKPGEVDLSIDVDFENLKLLASPQVDVYGPTEQGDWLHEIGVGYRFDQLIKKANLMANKELIYESYLRLTSKDEKGMGKIYKFMGLLPKHSQRPVGFGVGE